MQCTWKVNLILVVPVASSSGTRRCLKHQKIYLAGEDQNDSRSSSNQLFACGICEQTFEMRNSYNHHTKSRKGSPDSITCSFCGKVFSVKRSLLQHKRTHADEKGYCCEICGKELTSKESLHCHVIMHSGERPLVCDVCVGRGFRIVSTLWFIGKYTLGSVLTSALLVADVLLKHEPLLCTDIPHGSDPICVSCATRTIMIMHMQKHDV